MKQIGNGSIYLDVSEYNGEKRIDIRKWYEKDGEMKPTRKGVNMSISEWDSFIDGIDLFESYVEKELGNEK